MNNKQASFFLTSLILIALVVFTFSKPLPSKTPQKQVRVYVDIVADLFHYGHAEFLKKAKAEGDYLIVGVMGDDNVTSYKRRPVMTLEERSHAVRNFPLVDEVIPGAPLVISEQFMKDHRIDLVIHGDDMPNEQLEHYYSVPMRLGKFKTVSYTTGISTTDLIKRIKARNDLQRKDSVQART